jgi:hypothetical protein
MRTLAFVSALLLAAACGGKQKADSGTTAGSSTMSPDHDHDKSTDESAKDKDKDDKTDEAAQDGDKDHDHDDHDDEGPAKK